MKCWKFSAGRLWDSVTYSSRHDISIWFTPSRLFTLHKESRICDVPLFYRALFLGPPSFPFSLSIFLLPSLALGRVFYIFVVRFSNGLARVSSASSVAHFEVGTSGGTFAPPVRRNATPPRESAPGSLFSHCTGTTRLFSPTANIILDKIHARGRETRGILRS